MRRLHGGGDAALGARANELELFCYIQGENHRNMPRGFGQYIELRVMVKSTELEQARALVEEYRNAQAESTTDDDEEEDDDDEDEATLSTTLGPSGGDRSRSCARVRALAAYSGASPPSGRGRERPAHSQDLEELIQVVEPSGLLRAKAHATVPGVERREVCLVEVASVRRCEREVEAWIAGSAAGPIDHRGDRTFRREEVVE